MRDMNLHLLTVFSPSAQNRTVEASIRLGRTQQQVHADTENRTALQNSKYFSSGSGPIMGSFAQGTSRIVLVLDLACGVLFQHETNKNGRFLVTRRGLGDEIDCVGSLVIRVAQ